MTYAEKLKAFRDLYERILKERVRETRKETDVMWSIDMSNAELEATLNAPIVLGMALDVTKGEDT